MRVRSGSQKRWDKVRGTTTWAHKAAQCPALLKEVRRGHPGLTDAQVLNMAAGILRDIAENTLYDVQLLVTCRKSDVDNIVAAIAVEAPTADVFEMDPVTK